MYVGFTANGSKLLVHVCVFPHPSKQAQETPLHIAARVKDGVRAAEMLLKSGADVNAEQEVGQKGAPLGHTVKLDIGCTETWH